MTSPTPIPPPRPAEDAASLPCAGCAAPAESTIPGATEESTGLVFTTGGDADVALSRQRPERSSRLEIRLCRNCLRHLARWGRLLDLTVA